MNKKTAKSLIQSGSILTKTPAAAGGSKYKINSESVQYKTALNLIQELNLKATIKTAALTNYEYPRTN